MFLYQIFAFTIYRNIKKYIKKIIEKQKYSTQTWNDKFELLASTKSKITEN